MRFQELRHLQRALAVLLHAQRQGHQPAQDQPGVERAERAAQVHQHLLADALDARLRPQHRAAQRIAVTVQVLGQAVDDEIRAQRKRALQRRAGPGRIDRQRAPGRVGDLGQRGDVGDAQDRVGGRLDIDQLRVRAQRGLHLLQVAGIHQADLDAKARQVQAEQLHRPGVADFAGDQVIALLRKVSTSAETAAIPVATATAGLGALPARPGGLPARAGWGCSSGYRHAAARAESSSSASISLPPKRGSLKVVAMCSGRRSAPVSGPAPRRRGRPGCRNSSIGAEIFRASN